MDQIESGSPIFVLSASSVGLSRSLVVDAATGVVEVLVGGGVVLTAPAGSHISASGQSLVVRSTEGDWSKTYTLTGTAITARFARTDASMSFDFALDPSTGQLQVSAAKLLGKTFSGGDLAAWLGSTQSGFDQQQRATASAAASSALSADLANISNGVTTGLTGETATLTAVSQLFHANALSSGYLGARIATGEITDKWVTALIGPPPGAVTSWVDLALVSAYSPEMAQAQARLLTFYTPNSIITAEVLGFGEPPNFIPAFPLVLDLDGSGIELVSQTASHAHFDARADGAHPQIGWVGATNGILVLDKNHNGVVDSAAEWFGERFSKDGATPPAGQKGFAALATLAKVGATSFSRATALVDAATGKNYFDETQVWVDGDQDGVTDAGELHSLAELGIVSIDLTAQTIDRVVNGNLVASKGGYTLADGTRRAIDDIGLATQSTAASDAAALNATTVAFAEIVARGLPASSAGKARAIATAVAGLPHGDLYQEYAGVAGMQYWMGFTRYYKPPLSPFVQMPSDKINVYGWPGDDTPSSPEPLDAPQNVFAALQLIDAARDAAQSGANGVATAADAMSAAQLSALTADFDPSAQHVAEAKDRARQAAAAFGESIGSVLGTEAAITRAGQAIADTSALFAQLTPVNYQLENHLPNGARFASSADAYLASGSFYALEDGLKRFAFLKDSLERTLSALGETGNYAKVLVGGDSVTTTASGDRILAIVAAGDETFVAGDGHDDFVLTASSGPVSIRNFDAGPNGDSLEFVNVGNSVTIAEDGQGGTRITYGVGQSVDLIGVTLAQMNLRVNILGIETASFATAQTGGTRSLGRMPVFCDGQIHITNLLASSQGNTLIGDGGDNQLKGGAGADVMIGGGGTDTLDGGAGIDEANYLDETASVSVTLNGAANATVTVGGAAEDTIRNIERVIGGSGADILTGDGFENFLAGDVGDDLLKGGGGADILSGGVGVDTVDYRDKTASVAVALSGAANVTVTVGGVAEDTIRSIENIYGGSVADVLTGDVFANVFRGGGGADKLDGGAGADTADYSDKTTSVVVTLNGATNATVTVNGVAEDTVRNIENVTGGSGSDTLTGDSLANVLVGGVGNDVLKGGDGADTLDGGSGVDVADYSDETASVAVRLSGATAASVMIGGVAEDVIRNIEIVSGGSGADTLTGDSLGNVLSGGDGNDLLKGGDGADTLNGGAGVDTADYSDETAAAAVTLNGAISASVTIGGVAEDTVRNIENVKGGSGSDTLIGDGYANVFRGGGGADKLDGGAGVDTADYSDKATAVVVTLNGAAYASVTVNSVAEDAIRNIENVTGGSGSDTLTGDSLANVLAGGAGNDVLTGGDGADTLIGGAGSDVFVFRPAFDQDTIVGFGADDTLRIDHTIFADWADLAAASRQVGANTVITVNASDAIILQNFALGSLTQAQAEFV